MTEIAIRLHVEPLDEGGFVATSPDVPGLVVEGQSLMETAAIAQTLATDMAQCYIDHGDPLPAVFRQPQAAAPVTLVVPVQVP